MAMFAMFAMLSYVRPLNNSSSETRFVLNHVESCKVQTSVSDQALSCDIGRHEASNYISLKQAVGIASFHTSRLISRSSDRNDLPSQNRQQATSKQRGDESA
jgi:hypothetical protein